jgi:hypothetical protein
MNLRLLAIRITLVMLAVTALSGLMLVIGDGRGDIGPRLLATGISGVALGGLMLPLALLMNRPRAALLAFGGACFLVLQFLCLVGLIWIATGPAEESLLWTMFTALVAVPGTAFVLATWPVRHLRVPSLLAAGATGVAVAAQLLDGWIDGPTLWRWMAQSDREAWMVATYALQIGGLVTAAAMVRPTPTRTWFGHAGLLLGAISTTALIVVIIVFDDSPATMRPAFELCLSGLLATTWIGIRAIAYSFELRGAAALLRFGTVAAAAGTAAAWMFAMWLRSDDLATVAGAMTVAVGAGALATIILGKVQSSPLLVGDTGGLRSLAVVCPRCGAHEDQPLGESACRHCGLRYRIEVESPGCAGCGHTLQGLESNACPECGHPIRTSVGPAVV